MELENKKTDLKIKNQELAEVEKIFLPNKDKFFTLTEECNQLKSAIDQKKSLLEKLKTELESFSGNNP